MEFLIVLAPLAAVILLATLAILFGVDSRPDFRDARHNW
jgi:hypothetical protein